MTRRIPGTVVPVICRGPIRHPRSEQILDEVERNLPIVGLSQGAGVDCVLLSAYPVDSIFATKTRALAAINDYWIGLSAPTQTRHLLARRDWPGQLLADRLEVSQRTVRRDVDRLREVIDAVDAPGVMAFMRFVPEVAAASQAFAPSLPAPSY